MSILDNDTEFSEETKGDVWIIRLHGRLDALSSPIIEERVLGHVSKNQCKLLLNIADVNYISSSGFKLLLLLTTKLRVLSGDLVLCKMAPDVREIVKMAGFLGMLTIVKDEEAALKKLSKE